jgi:hypothetical protein
MAVTTVVSGSFFSAWERSVETGGANAILTSTLTGKRRKLLAVTCVYSGAPTQAGVTVTLTSGGGTAYNIVLNTGTGNAQSTLYLPAVPFPIMADDTITVAAPAGGGILTAAIAIYTDPLA